MSQSTMKFASDSPQFSYVELTLVYVFRNLKRIQKLKLKSNFDFSVKTPASGFQSKNQNLLSIRNLK
ncbi:hypothetical protein FF021_20285 [Leptospira noguchii]|nr:hypothetical protein FF021_20285 [Leptospira noguchii]